MPSSDTRAHYRAIRAQLQEDEYLLWWGRPFKELQGRAQHIADLFITSFMFCGLGLAVTFILTSMSMDLPILTYAAPPLAFPLALILWQLLVSLNHRGPTLYALTNQRVVRATGSDPIGIDSAWLEELGHISVSECGSLGTIWGTLPERTRASRRGKGRYPIILGINHPEEVYALMVSARPELQERGTTGPALRS